MNWSHWILISHSKAVKVSQKVCWLKKSWFNLVHNGISSYSQIFCNIVQVVICIPAEERLKLNGDWLLRWVHRVCGCSQDQDTVPTTHTRLTLRLKTMWGCPTPWVLTSYIFQGIGAIKDIHRGGEIQPICNLYRDLSTGSVSKNFNESEGYLLCIEL